MHTTVLGIQYKYQVRPCAVEVERRTRPSGGQYATPSTGYEVLTTGSGRSGHWEWPFRSEAPLPNNERPELTRPRRRLAVQRRRIQDVPRRQARLESITLVRAVLERPTGHGARAVRSISAAGEHAGRHHDRDEGARAQIAPRFDLGGAQELADAAHLECGEV